MSKNEKFTAQMTEAAAENAVVEDVRLTTPQESNPLENDSESINAEGNTKTEETSQNESEEVEKGTDTQNENTEKVHNSKKIGAVAAAAAMVTLSLGAVGLFGASSRNAKAPEISAQTTVDRSSQVVAPNKKDEQSAVMGTIKWWKAGVEEYDFIFADEDIMITTPKQTTTVTTTTTPEPTTTTSATTTKQTTTAVTTTTEKVTTTTVATTEKKPEYTEEKISETTYYLTSNVNLRKGAGTSFGKIITLTKGSAVTAVAKVSNGWLKVNANGKTGYIIDDYVTTEKPVQTTTSATTTAKPAETTKPSADNSAVQTGAVISYTEEELEMFYYVVEGEVGGCSEQSKLAVANVIINRVKNSRFPNTLKGVMTAKSQFTAINNYYSKKRTPTASTKDCVNRALNGEDNSNGALYFYSKKYCSASTSAWFESLTFCLEIDGQRYFKY